MNNKALLLTMDNGSVVFAKLPNPCAGPAYYTTASEVATRTLVGAVTQTLISVRLKIMSQLSEVLDIPVPRILAWCARSDNPVGAEYILEERVRGQPLSSLWGDWTRLCLEDRFGIISQVVEIERKLTDAQLKHHGCVYFVEDFPHGERLEFVRMTSPSTLQNFRMGPFVTDLWTKEKASMDLNRGPCKYNA